MQENFPVIDVDNRLVEDTNKKPKSKRDIFRFAGEKPVAINLEHVTQINLDGNKITFQFYQTAMFVDFEEQGAAEKAFNTILKVWAEES